MGFASVCMQFHIKCIYYTIFLYFRQYEVLLSGTFSNQMQQKFNKSWGEMGSGKGRVRLNVCVYRQKARRCKGVLAKQKPLRLGEVSRGFLEKVFDFVLVFKTCFQVFFLSMIMLELRRATRTLACQTRLKTFGG